MIENGKIFLLIINWIIFFIAGVIFIQQGVKHQKRAIRSAHKITKATLVVRGNVSITIGIVCLLWVIYGVIWLYLQ
jgi:hypothetical protein